MSIIMSHNFAVLINFDFKRFGFLFCDGINGNFISFGLHLGL